MSGPPRTRATARTRAIRAEITSTSGAEAGRSEAVADAVSVASDAAVEP